MKVSRAAAHECPTTEELAQILDQTADVDNELSGHIESCRSCQQILEWIAGDESFWRNAERSLQVTAFEDNQYQATTRIVDSICALSRHEDPQILDPLCKHEIEQMTSLLDPASHPELLGRIGRYELEQLVGRGGMGLVFRGYDTELHRVVAVKTLAIHLVPMQAARERFIREGRACASLVHPHIVPVHDVITEGPVPALVMQYVAGPSLEQHLREHGPLELDQSLSLMEQLCEALSVAHGKGFVHRDIKPGNVLLEVDASRALLTDFGLVRTLDDATLTRSGMLAGTPDYMSPEQARGERAEVASDMFSLGSLFYCMLAGHAPFRAVEPMAVMNQICHQAHTPIRELQPAVPSQVSELIDRLLVKDPKARLGTASELSKSLIGLRGGSNSILARHPIDTFAESQKTSSQLAGWNVASQKWVAIAAVALLLLGAGLWWKFNHDKQSRSVESELSALERKLQGLDAGSEMSADRLLENIVRMDDEIQQLDLEVDDLRFEDFEVDSSFGGILEADFSAGDFDQELNGIWGELRRIESELQH